MNKESQTARSYTNFGRENATLRKTYNVSFRELARNEIISFDQAQIINTASRSPEHLERTARLHSETLYDLLKRLALYITSEEVEDPDSDVFKKVLDRIEERYEEAIFTDIGTTCAWSPKEK